MLLETEWSFFVIEDHSNYTRLERENEKNREKKFKTLQDRLENGCYVHRMGIAWSIRADRSDLMTTNIVLACLLVLQIGTGIVLTWLIREREEATKKIELYQEWIKTISDLATVTANEQDKILYRLSVAEERILNLTNKTGQMSVKLKKMDANTIYEVKDAE